MCGIVGIHGLAGEVANQTYFALFAVQHRGQESAGIAVADGTDISEHRGMGLVSHVFSDEALESLTLHRLVRPEGDLRYPLLVA